MNAKKNYRSDLCTSDGLCELMRLEKWLTHAEFRLLFMLADSPRGNCFERSLEALLRVGNFSMLEIDVAVSRLKWHRDFNGSINLLPEGVVWRLRNA